MNTHNLYSKLSVASVVIALVGLIALNIHLAEHYKKADGKTKALFGLIELGHLTYNYAIGATAIIALILLFVAIKKNESRTLIRLALALFLLTAVLIFAQLWKLII